MLPSIWGTWCQALILKQGPHIFPLEKHSRNSLVWDQHMFISPQAISHVISREVTRFIHCCWPKERLLWHLINVLRHKANEFANSAPSEGASHPSKYTWMRLMIWNMGYCLPFGPNDVTHNSPNWVSGYDHRLLLFSCCQVCGFAGFDPFRTQGAEAAAGECCSHCGRQELKKGKENRAEPLTASPWMDPITYSWVSVIWGWRVGGGGHLLVINMID